MSTQVQFRRGTTTQNNAFTGAVGELSVDTDLKTLRLHDGTTAGGGSVMLNNVSAQTALNKTFSTGSVWQGNAVGLGYGGTGSALTAAAGAVAYSTASGLGLSAAGTSGQVLVSGGTNAPTWVAASSISAGTATLATTATNIAGGSAGQLIIQADTGLSTFITAGASGTFLRSAGAGYAPTWATADITIGSTVISLGSSTTGLAGVDIIAATGTSHWTIPVGTTAQRPASPATGMIRYNSSITSFEGYSSGAWSSLGGVSSVDKFTYIQAETSANASNGDLDFFAENAAGTAAQQVGQWNRTNLKDYTGTLVGTQTTQNVFNATATTINAFGAATAITLGATTGTLTLRNPTIVGAATTQALFDTVATTLNIGGAATTVTLGNATAATLTIRPGTVVGSNTTQNLFNTVATTMNFAGAATTLAIGNATGATLTLNPGTVVGANATQNLYNTVATTLNIGGASTALNLGATSGTATINNPTVVGTQGTVNLWNTTSTTVNAFGAATTISIGASTGNTTVNNNLIVTGNLTVNGTTTTVNATTVQVADKNIELGITGTPTDTTANGGGITLKGATDKTINWDSTNTNWTSSEHWNIATGKTFKINNVPVLTATAVLNDSSQTSITIGGSATAITLGANSGTLTIGNPTVVGTQTTQNLFNTVATTLNIGGAATALNLGASTGTTTVNNDLTVASGKKIVMTNVYDIVAFSGSTSGATATAITSLSSTVYRSGKVVMSVTNGTSYRIMEMLFMHDGTTVTFNENYTVANEMQSATTNTTFSGSISAGTLTIYATCSSGTAAIKGQATLFKV